MTTKVLGSMLQTAGIGFLYYLGAMTQKQKSTALVDFRDDPGKKVLVSCLMFNSSRRLLISIRSRP